MRALTPGDNPKKALNLRGDQGKRNGREVERAGGGGGGEGEKIRQRKKKRPKKDH